MGQRGGASFDPHLSQYKYSDLALSNKNWSKLQHYFINMGQIIKNYMIQLTHFHLQK